MKARTIEAEKEEFDPHSVEHISRSDVDSLLSRFTEDMDPWAIDVVRLADRYKSYVEKMEDFDLEVPGKVILVCAVLLRLKAEILRDVHREEVDVEEEEEEFYEEEDFEEVLRIPENVPKPPVKKMSRRRVSLEELREALDRALEIEEKRERRQEERGTEDYGISVEEKDISRRLDGLYSRLKNYLGSGGDSLTFSDLVENEEKREMIEEFVNVIHLETEERIRCIQEEFLGDIEIEVLEN